MENVVDLDFFIVDDIFFGVLILFGVVVIGGWLLFMLCACCIACCAACQHSMSNLELENLQNATQTDRWDKEKFKEMIGSGISPRKEAVLLKLIEKKLGAQAKAASGSCMREAQDALPDLLELAKINPFEFGKRVLMKKDQKDAKGMATVIQGMLSAFVLQHGPTLAKEGLGGLNLDSCGNLLCGGDLKYKLDEFGVHKCEWDCLRNYYPDEFKLLQASSAHSAQNFDSWKADVKELLQSEERAEAAQNLEKSSAWGKIMHQAAKIPYEWTPAHSKSDLRILEMLSTSQLANPGNFIHPVAFRYEGKCRARKWREGQFVKFKGENPKIPKGAVVKIHYFHPFKPMVQVMYMGSVIGVDKSELEETNLIPVELSQETQQWLMATKTDLQVHLPAVGDPSGDPGVFLVPAVKTES